MKTIPIIILAELCESLCASDFKLSLENGIIGSNLPDTPIDLYASSDLRGWKLVRSFTNSTKVSGSNYFRARVRPTPPDIRVSTTTRGTLASISGTASQPLASIWATNGAKVAQGRVVRRHLDTGVVDWVLTPLNADGGQVQLRFEDLDRNVVLTNVVIGCSVVNPMKITFPANGSAVVGNECLVTGIVDRNDSIVWVDTGIEVYMAVVREGRFVTGKIPVKASNHWEIHCLSDIYDEVVEEVSFTKSPVTISYTVENWTKIYGERGIVLRGTISDPAYDVMVGTNHITTTNGHWNIKIPPPENGLLPFSVKPKMGFQSTSAGGVDFIDMGMTSYCYAEIQSYNYYGRDKTNTVLSQFNGWDKFNRLSSRRIDRYGDCMILFSGMGEYLAKNPEGNCDGPVVRALFPNSYMGDYFDGIMGCKTTSTLMFNLGGSAADQTKYRVIIDLVLYGVYRKEGDEVWFTEHAIDNAGWTVAGNSLPWTFEAYSQIEFDATPTPKPFDSNWYYYDLSIQKEPIIK